MFGKLCQPRKIPDFLHLSNDRIKIVVRRKARTTFKIKNKYIIRHVTDA